MTPLKFAKCECANFKNDGSCLGVRAEDLIDTNGPWWNRKDSRAKYLQPRQQCALAKAGERCLYFEQVVLPLADCPSPKDEPSLQAKRQKARVLYLKRIGLDGPKKAKQRFCECGAPIGKGRRHCDKCAAKKRSETRRKSQKWRAKKMRPVEQLNENSVLDFEGFQEGAVG